MIYNSIKLNKLKPWTVDSRLTLLAQCNVPNVMRNVKFLLPKTSRRVTNIATLSIEGLIFNSFNVYAILLCYVYNTHRFWLLPGPRGSINLANDTKKTIKMTLKMIRKNYNNNIIVLDNKRQMIAEHNFIS